MLRWRLSTRCWPISRKRSELDTRTPLLDYASDYVDKDRLATNAPRWDAGKVSPPAFPGPVFEPTLDEVRLKGQQARIYLTMRDGVWRTLREISVLSAPAPEASVSAQLRVFRRPRHKGGFGWRLNKRRRGDPASGLWEYQVLVPLPPGPGNLFEN